MKNIDLFHRLQALGTLRDLPGVKFAYAVNKNLKKLQEATDSLREASEPTEAFKAYQEASKENFLAHVILDDNGQPKVIEENGQMVNKIDPEKKETFETEAEALKNEHQDAIDAREAQLKEYDALLQEDLSEPFEWHRVKLENVPENITTTQMAVVMEFLWDDED